MRVCSRPFLLKIPNLKIKLSAFSVTPSFCLSCNFKAKTYFSSKNEFINLSLFEVNKQLLNAFDDREIQRNIRNSNKEVISLCAEQTKILFGESAEENKSESFVRTENNLLFQTIIYNILTIGYKAKLVKYDNNANEDYRLKIGLICLTLDFAGTYIDQKAKNPIALDELADAEFFQVLSKTFDELTKETVFKFRLNESEINARLLKSFSSLFENLEELLKKVKTSFPANPVFVEVAVFLYNFSRVCAKPDSTDFIRLLDVVMNVYCILQPNSSVNFRRNPKNFMLNDNEQFILWAKNINFKKEAINKHDENQISSSNLSTPELLRRALYSLAEKLEIKLDEKSINNFKPLIDTLKPLAYQGINPKADTLLYYLDNVILKEFRELGKHRDLEEISYFETFGEFLEIFPLLNTENNQFDDLQIHLCKTLFMIGGSVLNSPSFFKLGNSKMNSLIMLLINVFRRRKVIDYDLLQQIEKILVSLIQWMKPSPFIQLMKFYSQVPIIIDLSELKHQVLHYAKSKFHIFDKEQLIDLGTALIKCSFQGDLLKDTKEIDIFKLMDLDWWVRMTETLIGIKKIELSDVQKVKFYLLLNLMKRTFGDLWNEALEKKLNNLYLDFTTIIEQNQSDFQKEVEEAIKNTQAPYISEALIDKVFSVDFLINDGKNAAAVIEADGPPHYFSVILENAQFKSKRDAEIIKKHAEYMPEHNIFGFFENRNTYLKRLFIQELGYTCLNLSIFDWQRLNQKHRQNLIIEFITKKCEKKDLLTYKK